MAGRGRVRIHSGRDVVRLPVDELRRRLHRRRSRGLVWNANSARRDTMESTTRDGVAWERIVTVKGAAEALGVNRQRVHQLIDAGKLEARKVDGIWLVDKASVDARNASGK
ncbi:MAG TPA: hypothetical protein DCP91_06765 [Eggerthellaceae bacterium]|nr:hypothetical protein [Eggerthellaceae bacterium]